MIASWRGAWGLKDFPFLWVQLPNYMAPVAEPSPTSNWATLRESQTAALRLPRTGQAVVIDLGEAGDIHPKNKHDVGVRLAAIARTVAYGQPVANSGPAFRRFSVGGNRVTIESNMPKGCGRDCLGERSELRLISGGDRHFVVGQG